MKAKIQTLRPLLFKTEHINNPDNDLLDDNHIDHFFIHSLKDESVELKLPLPPHRKTVNDFVFVQNGEMERTINLETFHLKAGDFLLVPKNSITTTTLVSQDLQGYFCHFSNEFLAGKTSLKMWNTHANSENLLSFQKEQIEILEPLLTRILFLYKNRRENPSNYSLIPFYLAAFIAEISVLLQNQTRNPSFHHPVLTEFKEKLQQNFKQIRSVQDYAALLYISPNHLNKIIKKETGKSASVIINETCILEAKVLLTQTTLDIGEIATELGFEDRSYFSRFFKKHAQISPVNYRKMIVLS